LFVLGFGFRGVCGQRNFVWPKKNIYTQMLAFMHSENRIRDQMLRD